MLELRIRLEGLRASATPLLDPPASWTARAPTAHDPSLVVSFAKAIVRLGGRAKLIEPDNTTLPGWPSIDEAGALRRAFFVEAAPEILPIDCDEPELEHQVWRLATELKCEGVTPVVLASGRPGHRHLFARIEDPARRARCAARAEMLGLKTKVAIRPPLAPHRLGLNVELLDPTDPHEALRALEPPVARWPGRLSARMARLLANGVFTAFGYRSRSEMICAIALAFVNAKQPFEAFVAAMRDRRNKAGEKLWTRDEPSTERYLLTCWLKALWRADRHPAVRDHEAALEALAELRMIADAQAWETRGGLYDFAVLVAHLTVAAKAGKFTYHADVRTIAGLAGVAISTVSAAEGRLVRAGWLRVKRPGNAHEATVWSIRRPPRTCTYSNTPISTGGGLNSNTPVSPSGGCMKSVRLRTVAAGNADRVVPGADLWRWQGLGKPALNVYRVLELELQPIDRIASRLGRRPWSVYRQLERLEPLQLARREGDRWGLGPADASQVAQTLGVAGVGQEQHVRHQRDREQHREGLLRRARAPRTQKGSEQ